MFPLVRCISHNLARAVMRQSPPWMIARQVIRGNPSQGFTLVEVLVALAAMALLSLLSWQGIDTLLRTREITQSQVNDTALVQVSLRQWQMDLDAMQPLPDLLPQGGVMWDGRVMRMVRRSPTPQSSGADGGVMVVAWTQRNDHWWRWQSSGLQTRAQVHQAWKAAAQWANNPIDESLRQSTRLMPTKGWTIFFFRGNSWSHPLSSQEPNQRSPDAVRIVLQLATPTEKAATSALTVDWVHPAFNPNRT